MNENLVRKTTGNAHTFFKGALAKQVKTDDLSSDDIIIAYVISRGLPLALLIQYIHVVSWAHQGQEKVVCVLPIF